MAETVVPPGFVPTLVSALSLTVAGVLWFEMREMRAEPLRGAVLVYDEVSMPGQVRPFTEAGFDPNAIIDQAVDRALARGFVLVQATPEVVAPETAMFRIDDFVAIPAGVAAEARPGEDLVPAPQVTLDRAPPAEPESIPEDLQPSTLDLDAWLNSQVTTPPSSGD